MIISYHFLLCVSHFCLSSGMTHSKWKCGKSVMGVGWFGGIHDNRKISKFPGIR